jgi:PPOX class probable FMN-dependent enzyme
MTTTDETVETNRFREIFGLPGSRAVTKVKDFMTPYVQEFIQNSPFAVMATSGTAGQCDASPKGGKPGFVKVLDDKHLLFPDVAGNKLFQSYQNVDANPNVGLIFLIPGLNDTVRVNGSVTIVSKEELAKQNVELALYELDDNSKHLQGMIIEVAEAYTHCPRALKFSKLWGVDEIQGNMANRPIPDRDTHIS